MVANDKRSLGSDVVVSWRSGVADWSGSGAVRLPKSRRKLFQSRVLPVVWLSTSPRLYHVCCKIKISFG
jgi:hypothetical protein